jgi:hypothetical protein
MPKVRYRGPHFERLNAYQRGFTPAFDDHARMTSTRAYDVDAQYNRRYAVCVHESAHACVAVVRGRPLYEVIVEDDDEIGVCRAYPPPSPGAAANASTKINYRGLCEGMTSNDYPWAFEHCISYMAGALAQSRVDPNPDRVRDGARSDHERAQILAEAVTDSDAAARDMLREARREAKTIIEDEWQHIERVARALYARGRLSEDEVRTAMYSIGHDRGPEALGLSGQERAGPMFVGGAWFGAPGY